MRRALIAGLLLLGSAPAYAGEPMIVLLDWQERHTLAGTTVALASTVGESFAFDVGECHRRLVLDLLYSPEDASASAPGVGKLSLSYEFVAQLRDADGVVATQRVRTPSYSIPLGVVASGAHELHVGLANGADVTWSVRVRAWSLPGEAACLDPIEISEVEANPAGTDAGAEWVELHNPNLEAIDVSGWGLSTTHGIAASLTIPDGTIIDAGGRVVVTFPSQALDNEDESVELRDGLGMLRDATPILDDAADDARTWQRHVDGSWSFATGTPAAPPQPKP